MVTTISKTQLSVQKTTGTEGKTNAPSEVIRYRGVTHDTCAGDVLNTL